MISLEDRLAIFELIASHGHLVDDGNLEDLDQVFAPDAVFDLTAFGQPEPCGLLQVIELGRALGDDNPVGHHVTNVVISRIESPDRVRTRSKGIGVHLGGSTTSAIYEDLLVKRDGAWRIQLRTILVRRRPLGRV
jgi:hypothetical protein